MTAWGAAPKIPRLIKEIPTVTLEELYALIGPDMKAVDAVIRDRLYSDVVLVRQVAEYIINSGGKRMRPALALLFAVPALSLLGVPPLSGFWARLLVLQEAFAQERYAWGALGFIVSSLTLYSMMKIWIEAFW